MAVVLSNLNFKGGVGKTTTTINLATALWLLGKKVLVIDTDPQCNLTNLIGFDQTENDNTIYEWITQEECVPPVYIHYEGFYFIPAHKKLRDIEIDLMKRKNRERILTKKLSLIKDKFDYILIDCAPKDGIMNDNAMSASDSVLIPAECSGFSLQGMQDLLDSIQDVKENINDNLDILGFLIIKYDKNTRISKQTLDYFNAQYPNKIFQTKIRKNVKFDETPLKNKSIFEHSIDANGAEDYMSLAEEITGEQRPENWKERILLAWLEEHPEDEYTIEQLNNLKKQ